MNLIPQITPIPIADKTPVSLNIPQALITAIFAVLSGFILYLLKAWVDEGWMRYRRKYKELQADISFLLVKNANVIMCIVSKPDERHEQTSKELREAGARLSSLAIERPRICPGVPKKETLNKACGEMIGLSNTMYSNKENLSIHMEHNEKRMDDVRKLLKIELFRR